jgi:hypothetical protein
VYEVRELDELTEQWLQEKLCKWTAFYSWNERGNFCCDDQIDPFTVGAVKEHLILCKICITSLFNLFLYLVHWPFSDIVLKYILEPGSAFVWGLNLTGLNELVSITAHCVVSIKSRWSVMSRV